jgi:hypothetical protein
VGGWGAPVDVTTDGGHPVPAIRDGIALTFPIGPGLVYRVRRASDRR